MSFQSILPRILPAGDAALVVEFGSIVDEVLNERVLALDLALAEDMPPGVVETVPTYRSLMVVYDPEATDLLSLRARLLRLASAPPDAAAPPAPRRFVVPVVYGGEEGEDLAAVAAATGLGQDEFVRRHSAAEYRVHMIGFLPGFAYLGGLDPALHLPRRPEPRPRVPAGSVGIGGTQTGVYSVACPSGWHMLGRTPVRVFDPQRREPFLFAPGDRVRFRPVPADAWDPLVRRAAAGEPLVEAPVEEAPAEPMAEACGIPA